MAEREAATATTGPPKLAGKAIAVFLFSFVVYVLSPTLQVGDSYLSVPTAWSVVHEGTLNLKALGPSIPVGHDLAVKRANGAITDYQPITASTSEVVYRTPGTRTYDYFPWTTDLFAVPAVVVVDAASKVFHTRSTRAFIDSGDTGRIQAVTAGLLVAGATLVVFLLVWELLAALARRPRIAAAFVVAFGFAFGTSAWSTASRALWQHAPSLLLVSLALLFAVRLDREPRAQRSQWVGLGLGSSIAGAYAVRPTNAILVACLLVWAAIRLRRGLVAVVAGALLVAIPFVAVNLAEFGTLLPPVLLRRSARVCEWRSARRRPLQRESRSPDIQPHLGSGRLRRHHLAAAQRP